MAALIVHGIVNSLGDPYKDQTPNLEIRVSLSKAAGLPHEVGKQVPVALKLGKRWYDGKIHATERTKFAYLSPTLTREGKESTLGHVLKSLQVGMNARVQLKVRGKRIQVCDKWGNGLGTSAAQLNHVIDHEPKSLRQICDEAGIHNLRRVHPHMKFLRDGGRIAQLEDGRYVAPTEPSAVPPTDVIIAEKIIQAIAEHIALDLNSQFLAGDIRRLADVPTGSFSPVLKGMRDQPGSAPTVRADLQGVVQMLSRGVYRLTDRGKAHVQSILAKMRRTDAEGGSTKKSGGGGFGSAESNALVEAAARKAVWDMYEAKGWQVVSVEHLKCGHDLECQKGNQEEHVEVKGTSGAEQSFPITRGEVRAAKRDQKWHLCVVTSALDTTNQKVMKHDRDDFLARFDLEPLQYMARLAR